jgi:catechol 2,3-dioxygenase-like lactoylglutathione lyase family enzyme
VLGLDHVVLRVRDLERSLHFYTEVLDCREERRIDDLGLVQLRAGASLIDLVPLDGALGRAGGAPPAAGGRNVDHVALRIERFDGPRLRSHLEAHGIEVGEVARRYGAEGFGPSLYVRDPDGNVVELKGPAEPEPDA